MSDAIMLTGSCLCRSVLYRLEGTPLWFAHCHCDSCRRHTSAAFASFIGARTRDIHWMGAERTFYQSSPGVLRGFCGNCGSPMTYENSQRFPGETHLYLGSLDDPNCVRMQSHVHIDEQLSWLDIDDDLPRFSTTGGGGAAPVRIGPRRPGSKSNSTS